MVHIERHRKWVAVAITGLLVAACGGATSTTSSPSGTTTPPAAATSPSAPAITTTQTAAVPAAVSEGALSPDDLDDSMIDTVVTVYGTVVDVLQDETGLAVFITGEQARIGIRIESDVWEEMDGYRQAQFTTVGGAVEATGMLVRPGDAELFVVLGAGVGPGLTEALPQEFWEELFADDAGFIVRGKPARHVIRAGFEAAAPKNLYPVPYIAAAHFHWFCPAEERGEEYLLAEIRKEASALRDDLGIEAVFVPLLFMQDPDPSGDKFFLDNLVDYGPGACRDVTDRQDIFENYPGRRLGPEAWRTLISTFRDLGLDVIIRLEELGRPWDADPPSDNRYYTDDIDAFYRALFPLLQPYLEVAEQEGVLMVILGQEHMIGDAVRTPRINEAYSEFFIPAVREVYSGLLSYGENVEFVGDVTFWADLDYLGVDFYAPLTDVAQPTVDEMAAGISEVFATEIAPAREAADVPVILIEWAYNSAPGDHLPCAELGDKYRCAPACGRAGDCTLGSVDMQEQVDEHLATFQFIDATPWMYGGIIFNPGYIVGDL